MQIGILEPEDFSHKAISKLKKIGEVSCYQESQSIKDFIKDKTILFVRLKYYLGSDLLGASSDLKYVCSPTTGLNHLDIGFLKKKKICIVSLKDESVFLSNIRATPEHTFGLILSLLRNYKKSFINVKSNFNRDLYKGYEIFENSIGIIGFGRVGKILAKYVTAFDGKSFFYDNDLSIKSEHGSVKVDSIEELISKVNIICVCASYSKINDKFFNSKYIDMLKNKFFINTSRGELIDEKYLIKRLNEGYFKGVALDVISNESLSNNLDSFIGITNKNLNFILTPHISGATFSSMERTEEFITNKLIEIIKA